MTTPTPPNVASIDEALHRLQADPPTLTKNRDGQVGNQRTKYADLVQVNQQVLSRLNALGVVWKTRPTLLPPEFARFVLEYELLHVPSGTFVMGTYPLKGENPQQQGSSITYARRYALLAITGIAAEEEDDDGGGGGYRGAARRERVPAAPQATGGDQPPARAQRARPANPPPLPGEQPSGPTDAQTRKLAVEFRELGVEDRNERLALVSSMVGRQVESANHLTRREASAVIDALVEGRAGGPAGVVGAYHRKNGGPPVAAAEPAADVEEPPYDPGPMPDGEDGWPVASTPGGAR